MPILIRLSSNSSLLRLMERVSTSCEIHEVASTVIRLDHHHVLLRGIIFRVRSSTIRPI